MKKIFMMLVLLLSIQCVYADSWDDFSQVGNMWDGQKSITNKEFEEAYNYIEQKNNKSKEKQQEKKTKKLLVVEIVCTQNCLWIKI